MQADEDGHQRYARPSAAFFSAAMFNLLHLVHFLLRLAEDGE
jgi:hypothetical protein